MKRVTAMLLICVYLAISIFSLAEESVKGTWEGDIYTNQYSGITFTLPEGWIHDDEKLSPSPVMDLIVADESGENAVAIAYLNSNAIQQLIPSDILGPYSQLIQNSLSFLSEQMILELFTSAITANDKTAKTQIDEIVIGDTAYVMLRSGMNDGALMQCVLIHIDGSYLSVLMFSSSNGMETERFLECFS